jgi:hypothetical protein
MTKAPTKSAMPAKTSSAVRRNPKSSWMDVVCSSAFSWPVRTEACSPRSASRTPSRASSALTPLCATAWISSNRPTRSVISCAWRRFSSTTVAPANESVAPYFAMPTSR